MSDGAIQLSVVAAVFNAEPTFGETLKCLFDSDIPVPYEVIIVDDASTDGTPELCETFDLKLIRLDTNVGPSAARNRAIQESSGPIIMFLDSDVRFGPELIRMMLERMEADPEAAGVGSISAPEALNPSFYSNYFAMQEWESIAGAVRHDPLNHRLGICTRCGTLRRSIFDEAGGFDERYTLPSVEDYDLSLRILPKYRFIWDPALENDHFFPETLMRIVKRYHRNTIEVVGLSKRYDMETSGFYKKDSRARLFFGLAGLSALLVPLYPPLSLVTALFLLLGLSAKIELFSLFLRRKGLLFCLRGIAVYNLTSIPIATGLLSSRLNKTDAL